MASRYQLAGLMNLTASGIQVGKDLPALPDDVKADIRNVFKLFDVGGEGYITLQEVGIAMRALDLAVTHDEMQRLKLVSQRAHGRSGVVRYSEFLPFVAQKMVTRDPLEELSRIFKLFDVHDVGYITLEDLKRKTVECGEVLTDVELAEMIAEADTQGNGTVSQEDFVRMLRKTERLLTRGA